MLGSQKYSLGYSPNSDWNRQSNLLKVFGVSLQMSSDRIKYFGFKLDQFTELVFTVKIAQLRHNHLWDCRSWSQIDYMPDSQKPNNFTLYISLVNSSNVKPEYFLGSLDISNTIKKFERIFQWKFCDNFWLPGTQSIWGLDPQCHKWWCR